MAEYDALLEPAPTPPKASEYDALLAPPTPVAPIIPRSAAQMESLGARELLRTSPGEIRGTGEQPIIPIPRIPQQAGTVAQIGAGLANVGAGVAEMIETPQMLASLPILPAKLTNAIFGGLALKGAVEAGREAFAPGKTTQERVESGGRGLVDAIFGVGMLKGALARGPKEPLGEAEKPAATEPAAKGERPKSSPSQITNAAQARLNALEEAKNPQDQIVGFDPNTGKPITKPSYVIGRRLNPDEQAEYDFLKENINDPQKLAEGYGHELTAEPHPAQSLMTERNRLFVQELPKQAKGSVGEARVQKQIADLDERIRQIHEEYLKPINEQMRSQLAAAFEQQFPGKELPENLKPAAPQAEQAAKEVIPSATEERQVAEGDLTKYPGDETRGTPAEAGGRRGVEPSAQVGEKAPVVAAIGDTVSFRHPALGELSGSVTRELSDGSFEVKTPQGDVQVDPSELTAARKGVASQSQETAPTPAMEARMQREHEAQLKSEFKQYAERGGDELLDVVKSAGGVPALSSARKQFSGELQNIREAWKAPRKERIAYSSLFSKDAPDIDVLTSNLKAKGFDVETPADTLTLIENRIRTGQPVYGSEARGAALEEASMGGMGAARAGEIPEAKVVGMKNRMVDEERAKRGWLPLMEPMRQSMGKAWDKAMERIEAGERSGENVGAKMVDDVLSGRKKDVSEVDQGVIAHEWTRNRNERDMAADRINDPHTSMEDRVEAQNAWAAAEDRVNQSELALHETGTIAGRALQFRQGLIADDYTFDGIERRVRASKGGEPLSEEESTRIQQVSDELINTEKEITDRQTAVHEAGAQEAMDLSVSGLKKRAKSEKAPANLDDQRERIHEGLMDRAEEGDGLEDVGGLIHQLALNFVRSGITEREALIDAVHGVVGDIFGVERSATRDAISGYGKYHQLDPEGAKVQLRQLKGEMQQIGKLENMAEGIAPKKTGVERRTPSDEERRLIREVNEMKKRGGFEVTDPATQLKSSLDAVKTRLRNQIRDLHNSIANREPIVNKKGEIQYDEEAAKLRTMRDALKAHYDEIFGKPGLTDEQRLKVAQSAAERSLRDWQSRLDEAKQGIFKQPDKTKLTSPQIEAIRAHREAVKAEVEALAKLDPGVQQFREQVALASYKARIQQRIADMQEKIANGDFTTEKRKPQRIDNEVQRLQAKAADLRGEIDRGIIQRQLENRTSSEWLQDTFLKYRRGFVLSWPTIFSKLTSAAFLRMVSEPIEAGVRAGLRQLPGIKQIAGRAEIGQTSGRTIARATASAFTDGMKDAYQTLRTGKSELDRVYGRKDVMPREWIDFFGTLHAVLKAPIKRYGFEVAMRDQMEHGLRNGVDITDPFIQTQMAMRAYAHGERLIFLQNNQAVSAFNMAMRRLEAPTKETGRPSAGGKLLATTLRTPLPIMKVPTNILAEMFDYTLGSLTGGKNVFRALKEPISNLTPQQAETIMRQLSKGSLGGALLIIGYLNRDKIGGYYQQREKRGAQEPGPEEVIINGHRFGRTIFHSAVAGPLMVGATIGRVADARIKGVPRGLGEGIIEGLLGPITEVPFFTGPERVIEMTKAPSKTTAAGQMAADIVIPGAVQAAARATDVTGDTGVLPTAKRLVGLGEPGEVVKRQPQNFWQAIMEKIPFKRQELPIKGRKKGIQPLQAAQ